MFDAPDGLHVVLGFSHADIEAYDDALATTPPPLIEQLIRESLTPFDEGWERERYKSIMRPW